MYFLLCIFIIFSSCCAESEGSRDQEMPQKQEAGNRRKRIDIAESSMFFLTNIAGFGLDVYLAASPLTTPSARIASVFTGLNHLASAAYKDSAAEETKGRLITTNFISVLTTSVILATIINSPTITAIYVGKAITQVTSLAYAAFK